MRDGQPKRLRELAPSGSRLGRGLSVARGRGPSEAELRALGAAVFGSSAIGATAAAKAGAASVKVAGLTKATVALVLAGTVAGTAGVAWHHRHRIPSTEAALSAPARVHVAEPGLGADPVRIEPAAPQAASPQRPASTVERRRPPAAPITSRPPPRAPTVAAPSAASTPPAAQNDADEELRLVGAAQRALPRDPTLALTLAREHARRFPDGVLAQERDAVTVSALWETGRHDEASDRARQFLAEHPRSTYVGRMREILRQAELPAP